MIVIANSKNISIVASETIPSMINSKALTCVTERINNKLECPQDKTISNTIGCNRQEKKINQPREEQNFWHSDQHERRERKSYRLKPRVVLQRSTSDGENMIKTAPQTFFKTNENYENVRIATYELDENDSYSSEIFQYNLTSRNNQKKRQNRTSSIFRSHDYSQEWLSVDTDMIVTAPQNFFTNEKFIKGLEHPSYDQTRSIFRKEECDFDSSKLFGDHLTLKRANPIHSIDDDTTIPLLKRAKPINYEYWKE